MKYFIILITLLLCSCSKKNEKRIYTDESFQGNEAINYTGFYLNVADETYAKVDEDSLVDFYQYFKSELFHQGVTHYDEGFDCNKFAAMYQALAQVKYFNETYKTGRPESLAVGEIWYKRDNGGEHAINFVITKRGIIFIEPQNGKEIILSKAERNSISFVRF